MFGDANNTRALPLRLFPGVLGIRRGARRKHGRQPRHDIGRRHRPGLFRHERLAFLHCSKPLRQGKLQHRIYQPEQDNQFFDQRRALRQRGRLLRTDIQRIPYGFRARNPGVNRRMQFVSPESADPYYRSQVPGRGYGYAFSASGSSVPFLKTNLPGNGPLYTIPGSQASWIPASGGTFTLDNGAGGPSIGHFNTSMTLLAQNLVWTNIDQVADSVLASTPTTLTWTAAIPTDSSA